MKNVKTKTKAKATAINYRLIALLEQLPSSKVEELLDFIVSEFVKMRWKMSKKDKKTKMKRRQEIKAKNTKHIFTRES